MSQDVSNQNSQNEPITRPIIIKNASYQQLTQYLNNNALLRPEDAHMFEIQFQNLVDGVFTIAVNQEKGFLEEEIKHLSELLQGEYKGNAEAERILTEYTDRLKKLEEIVNSINSSQS